MKKFSVIIIFLFCINSVLPAQNESPNILVIHSYNPDYPWTSNLDRGLTNTLIERYPFISLDKEFYDSKRYPAELVESPFYNHIKKKYEHKDFDIVLTSDDNALRFYLKYREELFPDTPCVFSGINNIDLYDLKKMDKITGISEDSDFVANLELLENIPLNIDTIAVISDPTTTGSADLIKFREISEPFKSRFDFIELVDLSIEELLSALEELSPTTAIFL